MAGKDRRVHTRIQVSAQVRVSGPKGVSMGTLRDLSKGGLGVYLKETLGSPGDTMEIFLPFTSGVEIAVMAELLRSHETPRGVLHGFKFNLVEPAMQEKLLELIDALLTSRGGDSRQHPRVSKRFPIRYGKLSELRAMLENISMGGLAMTVDAPVSLYEPIEISVPDISGDELLILKGRVIYQYSEERDGKLEHRVGIQFRELTATAETCLRELIKNVLDKDDKVKLEKD